MPVAWKQIWLSGWVPSPLTVATISGSSTVAASATDRTYTWEVATEDAAGLAGPYSSARSINFGAPVVVRGIQGASITCSAAVTATVVANHVFSATIAGSTT